MPQPQWDVLLVGSGPSGAQAAETLVGSGASVALLDVGSRDTTYEPLVPEGDFTSLRESDPRQHRYFLGDHFEGIPWDSVRTGAQLTPSRKVIQRHVEHLAPWRSESFFPLRSLAYGGLGVGWGAGCYAYSPDELKSIGLCPDEFRDAYQVISDRIGISVGEDDLREHVLEAIENTQPAVGIDNSGERILNAYARKREALNRDGIYVGRPSAAILTQNLGNRKKTAYDDMDFYANRGGSVYRPDLTFDALQEEKNFSYLPSTLVLAFRECGGHVEVDARNSESGERQTFSARRLVLAAGALGTGAIVMRSFPAIQRLPILCNPYTYVPCLHLPMLGKPLSREKTSLVQVMMVYRPPHAPEDLVTVSLYTYRSLLLYRLVREAPVNFADGRRLLHFLQSAFVVAGVHHRDVSTENKFFRLEPDPSTFTGDRLVAEYALTDGEQRRIHQREKVVRRALRALRAYPIKRVDPGPGSSIHYAGTLPVEEDGVAAGTTMPSGKLHGSEFVYVADGSCFRALPAKGITLTLMANGHRVAGNVLATL